jgi:hypothetical protein
VHPWTEGIHGIELGWLGWTKSRVYKGIPAGHHTFSIECLKDSDVSVDVVAGHPVVPSSFSVIELN